MRSDIRINTTNEGHLYGPRCVLPGWVSTARFCLISRLKVGAPLPKPRAGIADVDWSPLFPGAHNIRTNTNVACLVRTAPRPRPFILALSRLHVSAALPELYAGIADVGRRAGPLAQELQSG